MRRSFFCKVGVGHKFIGRTISMGKLPLFVRVPKNYSILYTMLICIVLCDILYSFLVVMDAHVNGNYCCEK